LAFIWAYFALTATSRDISGWSLREPSDPTVGIPLGFFIAEIPKQ
jgi:hypothetical protein